MAKYLNSQKDADWFACPSCGGEVRVGSAGCQQCRGRYADAEREDHLDGVDLPEDEEEFDYSDFVEREFGKKGTLKPPHLKWYWWVTGILLLLAMLASVW